MKTRMQGAKLHFVVVFGHHPVEGGVQPQKTNMFPVELM